jgi:hypothetical protein
MDSLLIPTTPPRGHRLRLAVFSLPTLIALVVAICVVMAALAFL